MLNVQLLELATPNDESLLWSPPSILDAPQHSVPLKQHVRSNIVAVWRQTTLWPQRLFSAKIIETEFFSQILLRSFQHLKNSQKLKSD